MRYNLKTLFKATTGACFYFAVSQSAGYGVTAALLPCLGLVYWAARSRRQGLLLRIRGFAGLVGLLVIWFLAVDRSAFHWYCSGCHSYCCFSQDRILGIPITNEKIYEEKSIVSLALRDLGVPCHHDDTENVLVWKLWGMIIRSSDLPGIWTLSGGSDRYTASISTRVRKLGQSNPDFANEMYRQVIVKQNFSYFWDALMADQTVYASLKEGTTQEVYAWLANVQVLNSREDGEIITPRDLKLLANEIYEAGATNVLALGISRHSAVKIDGGIYYPGDEDCNIALTYKADSERIEALVVEEATYMAIQLPVDEKSRAQVFVWEAKYRSFSGDPATSDFGQSCILFHFGRLDGYGNLLR